MRQVCFLLASIALGIGAVAQAPGSDKFEVLLRHGFELHQQARFTEAIPVLEEARRLQPGDYFANLLLGIDKLRTGAAEAAVPRLQLAARVRPSEAIPEEYLGEAEARLGNNARAAEAFQAAVERSHRQRTHWKPGLASRWNAFAISGRACAPQTPALACCIGWRRLRRIRSSL